MRLVPLRYDWRIGLAYLAGKTHLAIGLAAEKWEAAGLAVEAA